MAAAVSSPGLRSGWKRSAAHGGACVSLGGAATRWNEAQDGPCFRYAFLISASVASPLTPRRSSGVCTSSRQSAVLRVRRDERNSQKAKSTIDSPSGPLVRSTVAILRRRCGDESGDNVQSGRRAGCALAGQPKLDGNQFEKEMPYKTRPASLILTQHRQLRRPHQRLGWPSSDSRIS